MTEIRSAVALCCVYQSIWRGTGQEGAWEKCWGDRNVLCLDGGSGHMGVFICQALCPGIQNLGAWLSVPTCANGWGQPASHILRQCLAVGPGPTTAPVIAGWESHFLSALQPHHRAGHSFWPASLATGCLVEPPFLPFRYPSGTFLSPGCTWHYSSPIG